MTELSNREFEKQVEEAINIVADNHEKYVREQERLEQAGNKGFNAKMKKVLNRIMGTPEVLTKKEIIYYNNVNNELLILKNADGLIIGVLSLHKNMEAKISLVSNRPVFIIYRGNEVYLQKDVLKGVTRASFVGKDNFKEVTATYHDSYPMVEASKKIFSLIESKQYEDIDAYILYSMEELINNNLEAAATEQRQAYTEVYVANQRINKIKNSINEYQMSGKDYSPLLEMLDEEYRLVCEKLINFGLYNVTRNKF